MNASRTLLFIPTYNERENAPRMCQEIHALGLDADVLFVDDNSPDGTGELLEELKTRYPRLIVHHRAGRLGIGSAHFEAIEWAYGQGYQVLVTLDCDFTHAPSDIGSMIAALESCDVAVASRWLRADSLSGWNLFRRLLTNVGHALTRGLLHVPQDATGAFRAYRLDRVPPQVFRLVKSRGYSFFFESLFVLNRNGFAIRELPVALPARTYGHSKMSNAAAVKSALHVFELCLANLRRPEQFLVERVKPQLDPSLVDPQDWDSYWSGKGLRQAVANREAAYEGSNYDLVAGIYRRLVIKRNLDRAIRRVFPPGAVLLHAGCGSGQVDTGLQATMRITALDISPRALDLYLRNNPLAVAVKHGSIFHLPFPNESFDGIYNLGVMEHFTHGEITRILREFYRVLRSRGKIVLFWTHAWATSVLLLSGVHLVRGRLLGNQKKLHPPELSLMRSRQQARALLGGSGFDLVDYRFRLNDLFAQALIVGKKSAPEPALAPECARGDAGFTAA